MSLKYHTQMCVTVKFWGGGDAECEMLVDRRSCLYLQIGCVVKESLFSFPCAKTVFHIHTKASRGETTFGAKYLQSALPTTSAKALWTQGQLYSVLTTGHECLPPMSLGRGLFKIPRVLLTCVMPSHLKTLSAPVSLSVNGAIFLGLLAAALSSNAPRYSHLR